MMRFDPSTDKFNRDQLPSMIRHQVIKSEINSNLRILNAMADQRRCYACLQVSA